MLVHFLLWLNGLLPETPHPFNRAEHSEAQKKEGDHGGRLPYSQYEFKASGHVFKQYDRFFDVEGRGNFGTWLCGKRIADFACGGGGKTVWLALHGAEEAVGLDVEQDFIEQAHKFALSHDVNEKCRFYRRDVRESLLPEDHFDAVILNDAIDHIPDPERALREALRIVKPGGRVLINFESYYYFWGHHLWDAIRIPWLHLFTTEQFRIKLYKAAVVSLPNGRARIDFRISKDESGRESITYLNHLTLREFHRIVGSLREEQLLQNIQEHQKKLRRWPLRFLGSLPLLGELFLSTLVTVLQKSPVTRDSVARPIRSGVMKVLEGERERVTAP